MSSTQIFKVTQEGLVELAYEAPNSWRGAMNIWILIAIEYLDTPETQAPELMRYSAVGGAILASSNKPGGLLDKLWKLKKDPRLSVADLVTLLTTFDHAMVKKEHIPGVVGAFRIFCAKHIDCGNLQRQIDILWELYRDPDCQAVCWNQTSVVAGVWTVELTWDKLTGEADERPYDINRDRGHWFIFESVAKVLSEEAFQGLMVQGLVSADAF